MTVIMVWALFQALILRAAVLKNQIHVKVSLKCMAVVMHSLWSCFSPASDTDKRRWLVLTVFTVNRFLFMCTVTDIVDR